MSFMNVYMGYFIISAQSSERVVLALLNLGHVIIRQCSKKECARSVFSHAFLPINKFDFSKRWKGKEFAFQMVRQNSIMVLNWSAFERKVRRHILNIFPGQNLCNTFTLSFVIIWNESLIALRSVCAFSDFLKLLLFK